MTSFNLLTPNAKGELEGCAAYGTELEALESVSTSDSDFVIISAGSNAEEVAAVAATVYHQCDLSHAGLLFGGAGQFSLSKLSCLNWFLLDPDSRSKCVSWRATPNLCMIRPQVLRELGGFDLAYRSPTARLMDFGFRLLAAGGRAEHNPEWAANLKVEPVARVPLVDEFVFLLRQIGRPHAIWAAIWAPLAGQNPVKAWTSLIHAWRLVRRTPAPPRRRLTSTRLLGSEKKQEVTGVTAIVPTLNRYEYVQRSIESLLTQTPPPDEIIVVDQTPENRRDPEIYSPFEGPGFRVIYQDKPGQSTSRNAAISEAKFEWCLLWEDDTEAWADMMAEHIRAVEYSGADASTGVSLAPWKTAEHIAPEKRHQQLSDIFATGNALVRRSALLEVGGLDLAFNRGAGADHDLGVRMYLSGKEILFNPYAIETHHKAATGGMRTFGAWWRNSGTWLSPFPPPTQVYTIKRYYPRAFWMPLYLIHFFTAAKQHRSTELAWLWLMAPWKLWRATRAAAKLQTRLGLKEVDLKA